MFLSNTISKNRCLNVSWEINFNVILMYYCTGCHLDEPVGLFWMVTELFVNNEKILQALQIFMRVILAPLKGQQLSRPLSIEGCELTYRLIMEFPAQEVKYKMLWMFVYRYEWTFHHGVIGFCGSPTQRRTSPALHTARSAWKCGRDPHEIYSC